MSVTDAGVLANASAIKSLQSSATALFATALNPSAPQHSSALQSLHTLFHQRSENKRSVSGVLDDSDHFASLMGNCMHQSGVSAKPEGFNAILLPKLVHQFAYAIDRTQLTEEERENWKQMLHDATDPLVGMEKLNESVCVPAFHKGEGVLQLVLLSFETFKEDGDKKIRFVFANLSVNFSPGERYMIEHIYQSRSNFWGTKTSAWTKLTKLPCGGITTSMFMDANRTRHDRRCYHQGNLRVAQHPSAIIAEGRSP